MKHIVLFGAGKSATVLISYLKNLATTNRWKVTVADVNEAQLRSKVGHHELVSWAVTDVPDADQRNALVNTADVVISLLPPALHYLVAVSCLQFGKHLLTASYTDEKIRALAPQVAEKNLLFLCEMGLDPGIDHMSAMQLVHRIQALGGNITSFVSHCGGLVAFESDNNPWHYKVSWNPRNIVMAGKGGAVYRKNGQTVHKSYEALFDGVGVLELPNEEIWTWYPNRDSLGYLPLYQLEHVNTFIRTTLRHPDFTFGWKNIVDLKLTDETPVYQTDGMPVAEFFRLHFERHNFTGWLTDMLTTRLTFAKTMMEDLMKLMNAEQELEQVGMEKQETIMMVNEDGELAALEIEDVKDKAATAVALKMHEANLSLKQLFYLGLDSDEPINRGLCSAADVLQYLLETRLALQPGEKDMVLMVHEIEYELNGEINKIVSSLKLEGDDDIHTAMAKTVGLPLGIAARLLLEHQILERGLHIPTSPGIYEPVLRALEQHGIVFNETHEFGESSNL